ncbi:MAG TPA: patatin-like phospholipase family protein [Ottowia sp.]|uniref:patatin-like phospholipase family protein n=1 Tax=Ottowia sp. TaxID=1898956 RepID=UPI002C27502C|nr:patatin-like phospholipase family protein [Ottowia sp.]HMN21236.1 patatin-like phospholipase family protein [Ottowia sp.]
MSDQPKLCHLALQGGGAHGAFTWGVLDALLMDGRLAFAGISGTSAGALNAVALAHGWVDALDQKRDPAEGARAALARLWTRIMALGGVSDSAARLTRLMMGALPGALTQVSPYQSNPLDINPLRELVEREIDFERLTRLKSPRVFVAATDVATGHARIFSGRGLSAQSVMASACLPQLFRAPEIDGRLYWDGGYSANPALGPLVEMGETRDLLLVQINPLQRTGKLLTSEQISDRVNDLTFNASLIAQMRTIALINELVARGVVDEGLAPIRVHRIDGGEALAEMPADSKVAPQRRTVEKLFELGRESARRWLRRGLAAVGEKSTVNLRRDYGDPLRLEVDAAEAAPQGGVGSALLRYLWPRSGTNGDKPPPRG